MGHNHSKIASYTARWASHKLENNYTTEVLPQEWKFLSRVSLRSLGAGQQEEEPQENQANRVLKVRGVWSQGFHRGKGKQH